MINLIIWSKDRACQLHLLLESLTYHAPCLFNINIIYKASNEAYKAGYDKVKKKFKYHIFLDRKVNWIEETDGICNPTRQLINDQLENHTCFSTDDMVFYKKVEGLVEFALPKYYTEVFSFRLGENTIVQDCHTGELQPPLNNCYRSQNFVFWNCNKYHPFSNYGYPLALDTHVFKKEFAKYLVNAVEWKTSNELESKWQSPEIRSNAIYMSSFFQSVAVNIPMNNHSKITRFGEQFYYSTEKLNELYLNGECIDLYSIHNTNIIGCHQEIELNFRKL